MAKVSGTYNFQSLANDDLILDCFERIGFAGDQLVPVQMQSAQRSLNFLLLDWINKNINLWTVHKLYLSLNTGQGSYTLDTSITDVLEVLLRQFTRPLNGTPQSNDDNYDGLGGGDPTLPFTDTLNAGCQQDVVNGNISYDYGQVNRQLTNVTQQINFIGISSNTETLYTLVFESSNDTVTWTNLLTIPPQTFKTDVVVWFDILMPVSARYYRVRETGGATLSIQKLYFTNNITDLKMSPVSRESYLSIPQKFQQGKPSVYYFDKSLTPKLNIWLTPSSSYQVLQYSFIQTMYDAGTFFNTTSVPAKMYPALAAGLTWMLAVKYKPEMADSLKAQYEETFDIATRRDSENVDLKIGYDVSTFYTDGD
jgi:hypothetical protein